MPPLNPDADKPPENPWSRALWRIRHQGLKKASDHYLVNFTRWWTGASMVTLSYEPGEEKKI